MLEKLSKEDIPFTQVSNHILNDTDISFRAKGLYTYMVSKPNNWNFTIRGISSQTKDGYDSVRSALNELKENGYIIYTKNSDGTGNYNIVNKSSKKPKTENPTMAKTKALVEPKTENPKMGFPIKGRAKNGKPKNGFPNRISNKDISNKKKYTKKVSKLVKEYNENFDSNENFDLILEDFISYRKEIKKEIKTIHALRGYAKNLKEIADSGYDIKVAIQTMKENQWQTVKKDYLNISKNENTICGYTK